MQDTVKPKQDFDDEPAKIVQIAYRQMSEMSGIEDPCMKNVKSGLVVDTNNFVCTRRLLQMPVFETVTATISNMYHTVKQSNEIITSIFTTTEESLEQGVKLVEPVSQKIGNTLETPLKYVDNVLCESLDYLEDKVPSITATSGIFLTNIGNFFRTSMQSISNFYINALKIIQNITTPMSIEDSSNSTQKNVKTPKN